MKRLVLAGLALALLGGCGVQGALERPPPMWGDERARYEAEQRAREEAERAAPTPAPAPAPAASDSRLAQARRESSCSLFLITSWALA